MKMTYIFIIGNLEYIVMYIYCELVTGWVILKSQ